MGEKNVPAIPDQERMPVMMSRPSIFLDMQRFADAQRVATLLASSSLVPDHFRNSVANCTIALNLADRLGVDPFMMMQNMYVVHGRPGIEGKLAIALVEGTGRFSPLKFRFEGQGRTDKGVQRPESCVAYATELKTGEVIEGPPVTWKMAVTEGWTRDKKDQVSKWQTLPDLMFRYRAAMFFARVNCPGALLGLRSTDELEDIGAIPMQQVQPGLYEPVPGEGAAPPPPPDQEGETAPSPEDLAAQFDAAAKAAEADPEILELFLNRTATGNKKTVDEIKAEALKPNQSASFWKFYKAFEKQQKATAANAAAKGAKGGGSRERKAPAKPSTPTNGGNGQEEAKPKQPHMVRCPKDDTLIDADAGCPKCNNRKGCPAHPPDPEEESAGGNGDAQS